MLPILTGFDLTDEAKYIFRYIANSWIPPESRLDEAHTYHVIAVLILARSTLGRDALQAKLPGYFRMTTNYPYVARDIETMLRHRDYFKASYSYTRDPGRYTSVGEIVTWQAAKANLRTWFYGLPDWRDWTMEWDMYTLHSDGRVGRKGEDEQWWEDYHADGTWKIARTYRSVCGSYGAEISRGNTWPLRRILPRPDPMGGIHLDYGLVGGENTDGDSPSQVDESNSRSRGGNLDKQPSNDSSPGSNTGGEASRPTNYPWLW